MKIELPDNVNYFGQLYIQSYVTYRDLISEIATHILSLLKYRT